MTPPGWMLVGPRFSAFIQRLGITEQQAADGTRKQTGVRAALNRWYYGHGEATQNSLLIGSWAKALRVAPPRDIDVLFCMPVDIFHRYEARAGNRQSQLLQEVRSALSQTYPQTAIRGDGQVVVVPFVTMPVEVIPAFRLHTGQYLIADANGGGSYRTTDPSAELSVLEASDRATFGATRRLIRMAKQWQRHAHAPIKSFMLERLAVAFLETWQHATAGYEDWMVRDFFEFMLRYVGGSVQMPGTGEWVSIGDAWASRARTALATAQRACQYEAVNADRRAGAEWRSLFGSAIGPLS